jgi:hypothetical protein
MKRIMIKLFRKIREDILWAQECQEYYIKLHRFFKNGNPEKCRMIDYMRFDYLPTWFLRFLRK